MNKNSKFHNLSILLTLAMGIMVASNSYADVATARARAEAARSQANRAEVKAVDAQTAANAAKTGATNAQTAADQAKVEATAVGTKAATDLATAIRALNGAVGGARAAAVNGDRQLERKFKAEAERLQTEIEALKKRAQHECAAFDDKGSQAACLTMLEKINAKNGEVTMHGQDKDTEVQIAKVGQQSKVVQEIFDNANQNMDAIKAIQMGCVNQAFVDKDGVSKSKWECPKDMKRGPQLRYELTNVSKYGDHSVVIEPAESGGNSKWGKVLGFGAIGGAAGGALGWAFFPNHETMEDGSVMHRNYTGLVAGTAIGFVVTAVATLVIEELTE